MLVLVLVYFLLFSCLVIFFKHFVYILICRYFVHTVVVVLLFFNHVQRFEILVFMRFINMCLLLLLLLLGSKNFTDKKQNGCC